MARELFLLLALCLVCGCDQPDAVRHYTVARHQPARRTPAVAAQKSRMPHAKSGVAAGRMRLLGAIVPHDDQTWFFKILGPSEEVKQQIEPFVLFLKSLDFSEAAPHWRLPPGWQASSQPPVPGRFATIDVTADLALTVTALATPESDFEDYLLRNVNRWRDQLALPALNPGDLERNAVKFKIGDNEAWVVMIESAAGPEDAAGTSDAKPPPLPFTFEVPGEWRAAELNAFRRAAWEVRDGSLKATMTISTAGGDLAGNVNRWRGQLGLEPLARAEVANGLASINMGGLPAHLVELTAPMGASAPQAIIGAIVQSEGAQWFFKLQGDQDLVAREKERFLAFLESVRFGVKKEEQ
jgi:hypothetical protein